VLKKLIWAGTTSSSFAGASEALRVLADLEVSVKQVERRVREIGEERCEERDAVSQAYQELPLTERKSVPAGVAVPGVAVVEMDGGRLQIRDEAEPAAEATEAREKKRRGRFWREDKVGLLASMASVTSADDPCPSIPATFVDAERIPRLAQEFQAKSKSALKGAVADTGLSPGDSGASEAEPATVPNPASPPKYEPPELVTRSVVATKEKVEVFGELLASAAWERGFFGAKRRAFLGDGSNANWGVWERHFSSFTPIVDFIHVLTYVYGAAMAGGSFAEGWLRYRDWIGRVWSGRVSEVIGLLETRQRELGLSEKSDGGSHPRRVVAESLVYLRNQSGRMKYAEYRQAGLPITTAHVESTIKRMNYRVKGSEKFWSECGAESILQLRADVLSETEPLEGFWQRRAARMTGERRQNPDR